MMALFRKRPCERIPPLDQETNPKIREGLRILKKNLSALTAFLDWLKDFHNKNRAKLLVFDKYPCLQEEVENEKSPFEKTLTLLGNIWNKERTHQLESDELILDSSIRDLTDSIFASADIASELYTKLQHERDHLGKLEGTYQKMRRNKDMNGSSENLQVIDQYHAVETAEGNAEVAESDFLHAISKFEKLLNEELNNYLLNFISDKTAHYMALVPEINQSVLSGKRSPPWNTTNTEGGVQMKGSMLPTKPMEAQKEGTIGKKTFKHVSEELPNNFEEKASTNLDENSERRLTRMTLKEKLDMKRKQLSEAKEKTLKSHSAKPSLP